jgi:two-component system response regulator AtoC
LLDRSGKQVAAMTELEAARRYLAANDCDAVIAAGELAAQLAAGGVDDGGAPVAGVAGVVGVVRSRELAGAAALLGAGVDDVLAEPLDELAVALALRRAAAARAQGRRASAASGNGAAGGNGAVGGTGTGAGTSPLVGDGEAMQRLRAMIRQIAATRSTALILGESGTGKELVARAIHETSPRRSRRFVAVNCAAIPAALLESELFGHVRGAFTDAVRDKAGLFEEASGGTLFLDEVGELPVPLQAKLLRALQEGEIRRVGDTAPIKVDVRLIAATLRELADDVSAGRFREDLYYRLNVLPVRIPPLRERSEDVPQLARFFAVRHAARHGLGEVTLPDAVVAVLAAQPWPGNVRELENVIERALVLADGPEIDVAFLSTVMTMRAPAAAGSAGDELSIKKATRELEAELIRRALGVTGGNRTNAAKLLEISHRALLYKMKEYGIS